jgi:hypothetical protein
MSQGDAETPVRTGNRTVDEALEAIDALRERPVAEHPEVFASAHDALRRALDAEPEA